MCRTFSSRWPSSRSQPLRRGDARRSVHCLRREAGPRLLIRSSALVLLDLRAAGGHLESLRLVATTCAAYHLYHGPAALQAPERFVTLVETLLG